MSSLELIAELRKVADRIADMRADGWVAEIAEKLVEAERAVRLATLDIEIWTPKSSGQ